MGRNKGTFNFAANFEVLAQAPLDARQVVDTFNDLITPATWEDDDNNTWLFNGLLVVVANDPSTSLNGVYYLSDLDNYTAASVWIKSGSNQQVESLDASVVYNQQVNTSQDASIDILKTNVDSIETSIGVIKSDIDVLDSSVQTLESYQNIQDASIIQALGLESSINTIENRLDVLDSSVQTLESYQSVQDASIIVALSKDTSVQNVGGGEGVYRDTSGGFINLRTIVGSSSIDVSTQGDTIYLSIDASYSGGEINYGQNIGTGDVSLYYGKKNEALLFRTLKGSGNINLTYTDSSTVIVDVSGLVTDASIYGYGFIHETSLGPQFNWQSGLLYVDVSGGASDPSLNQLWALFGGTYDSSNFIDPNGTVTGNISELDRILALLTPPPPSSLSAINLSNPGYYSARMESTGTLVSGTITDDSTPTSTGSGYFLKEEDVELIALVSGTPDGSILVTSADMTGVSDQSLTITDDRDAYEGQVGKEGFWRELSASITTDSAFGASTSPYTYNLQYPDSGNETGTVTFYVDEPQTPSISSDSVDSYPTITRYVSGVPSYDVGDTLEISYSVDGGVGKFYHATTIGNVNLNAGDSVNSGLPGAPYLEGANVDVSAQILTFATGQYYEINNINISITPYNSKGSYVSGLITLDVSGRIDTTSDESDRVLSDAGLYPTSGYGGAYDSTQSLKTGVYVNELQKLNNLYRWPTGDYTPWQSGPDYSSGIGTATRWVTFSTTVTNATSFTLQFQNVSGFSADGQQITQDVSILARVDGSIPTAGWVNCNGPYPGVGNPTNDGDSAMVAGSSDADTKVVTFGTAPKTGTLYVRVGISNIGSLRFRTVTIT